MKVYCQTKQLESSFNPEASKIIEDFEQGRENLRGYANFVLFTGKVTEEPTTFEEAWYCQDPVNYRFIREKRRRWNLESGICQIK